MQNFRLAKSIHQFMFVGSVDEHTALNSRHDFTHLSQETLLIISWFVLDLKFHSPSFNIHILANQKSLFFLLARLFQKYGATFEAYISSSTNPEIVRGRSHLELHINDIRQPAGSKPKFWGILDVVLLKEMGLWFLFFLIRMIFIYGVGELLFFIIRRHLTFTPKYYISRYSRMESVPFQKNNNHTMDFFYIYSSSNYKITVLYKQHIVCICIHYLK